MIEFHIPSVEDLSWATACLNAGGRQACEYNFTNLMCWGASYQQEIACWNGSLLARFLTPAGPAYLWPAGSGDERTIIEALREDAHAHGSRLRLAAATAEDVEKLEYWYPGRFRALADPANADYCYDVEKMCTLAGKKLHGKRNHIHRFLEDHEGNWSFSPMSTADLPECLDVAADWREQSRKRGGATDLASMAAEKAALELSFRHFDALGLEGGVLRVDGKVIGFTVASRITDQICDVHFEKAYSDIQGAYPMVCREFARQLHERHPELVWLDRENDLGLEGLRKAKRSYHPDQMIEKYTLTELSRTGLERKDDPACWK